uniref:uncharacterized protein LOC129520609 n=1 Tax=Nyctereutes procyonoides TaxID=34880 RepID=UPI002443FFD2|nr:uncharacterized protein LOC129520609 [Nyctereutes procyonoides]
MSDIRCLSSSPLTALDPAARLLKQPEHRRALPVTSNHLPVLAALGCPLAASWYYLRLPGQLGSIWLRRERLLSHLGGSAAPLDVARSLPGVTAGVAVSPPTSLHSEAAPSTAAEGTTFPEKLDAVTLLLKTLRVFLFRVKARAGGLETLRDPPRPPHLLLRSHCLLVGSAPAAVACFSRIADCALTPPGPHTGCSCLRSSSVSWSLLVSLIIFKSLFNVFSFFREAFLTTLLRIALFQHFLAPFPVLFLFVALTTV